MATKRTYGIVPKSRHSMTWEQREAKLLKNYNHKRVLKGLQPVTLDDYRAQFKPRVVRPEDCKQVKPALETADTSSVK